jgi:hypothetical protein
MLCTQIVETCGDEVATALFGLFGGLLALFVVVLVVLFNLQCLHVLISVGCFVTSSAHAQGSTIFACIDISLSVTVFIAVTECVFYCE